MIGADKGDNTRPRRMKHKEHNGDMNASFDEVMQTARDLPRRFRRGLDARPEIVLLAVAGTSFVAGAVVGSRVGRAVVAALLPIGLQYLLASKVGTALLSRMTAAVQEAAGSERSRAQGSSVS